ncbi:lytic murein transglycosylase [Micromonospora sp. DT229]|uniref:lytic transglycosylase domain-containing protein n=1 Tax=Micromonospora sp. DT229 TaxID=3393430 RepID=UPI003CF0A16C
MADGDQNTPHRPLRSATPRADSDVAPEGRISRLPRPRRPWLRSTEPTGKSRPTPKDDPAPQAIGERPPTEPSAGTGKSGGDTPTPGKTETPSDTPTPGKTDSASDTPATGKTEEATAPAASTPDSTALVARRRRTRFAHAVRVPGPRAAARAAREWSKRPSGRLTLPGVFLLALVAATATAGAMLVPATIGGPSPVAATDGPGAADAPPSSEVAPPPGALPPLATLPPGMTPPNAPGTAAPPGAVPVGGRPSDALAGWAREVGAKVGIDPVAMQAYGYAEMVLAETNRSCGLSWTTLAAIGFVESRHGQANNARLGADGRAIPEIIGLPLDGQGGRMRIADTDRGALDGDTTYDRAIGPMQFIPTTWQEVGADADNDGRKDPHNIHDAALAAGVYLCRGNRNLTIPGDWWNAILSYNNVRPYAQDVFNTANRYGQASRT